MTTEEGGHAFPCPASDANNVYGEMDGNRHQPGMMLRDWFAGMAMQGLLASTTDADWDIGDLDEFCLRHVVSESFRAADAMIAARVKGAV